MIFATSPSGSLVYVSDIFSDVTGCSVHDLSGMNRLNIIHPDDRSILDQTFMSAVKSHSAYTLRHRLKYKDGLYRWVISGAIPSFDTLSRTFLGFLGSVTELNDQSSNVRSGGSIGRFIPPAFHANTAERDKINCAADHLLIAYALLDRGGHEPIQKAIELCLMMIERRFVSG